MNDEPIEEIAEHLSTATRSALAAGMHATSVAAGRQQQRDQQAAHVARQDQQRLEQQHRAIESAAVAASNVTDLAAQEKLLAETTVVAVRGTRDERARPWLEIIAATAGADTAAAVARSDKLDALTELLEDHQSLGDDSAAALSGALAGRDFDRANDPAALLHWRVSQHFGADDGAAAIAAAELVVDNEPIVPGSNSALNDTALTYRGADRDETDPGLELEHEHEHASAGR